MSDITWTPVNVRLGEIEPWQHNPRQSDKRARAALLSTLDEFGQPVPFIVGPKNEQGKYPLYDAHQRYAAWLPKFGAAFEVAAMVSSRPLTETERQKYVIQFHASTVGNWNADELSAWDAGLIDAWANIPDLTKGWKADIRIFDELHKSEAPAVDAEPQTDRAAELLEKWGTESGQLWALGDNRLLIGDCTIAENVSRLMDGVKIDCVFTSPPYNQGGKGKRLAPFYDGENDSKTKDEYREFLLSVLLRIAENCQPNASVLWNVMYNANSRDDYGKIVFSDRNPFLVRETIVWDKGHGFNVSTRGILSRNSELVFLMSLEEDYQTKQGEFETWFNTWKIGTQGSQTEGHGAAFPIELPEKGISQFCAGDIVYEPFGGTGTTIIAAQNLSRRCYAMEISDKYAAVILQRFADAFPSLPIRRVE
jgi:DNA modification methylase